MPDGTWEVEVIGADRVFDSLDTRRRWAAFPRALLQAGMAVQAEMQRAAKPHHDTGRLERGIHVAQQGAGLEAEVRVGISSAAVPEGRPLAFGWASKAGRQPPTEAIAAWLLRKGTISAMQGPGLLRVPSANLRLTARGRLAARRGHTMGAIAQERAVRGLAFVIARSIGRRGYSFGSHDWFHMGIHAARPRVRTIINAALRGDRS